mgnify:CR=1 FL=1
MHVLFVQAGDYTEAYNRLKADGAETYRDQRASVDWVETLSQDCSVTVLAIGPPQQDDTRLSPSLRSVNISYEQADKAWLRRFFDDVQPDRIICRIPHHIVLRLAKQRKIPTLAIFADYFSNESLRQTYRNLRLRLALTSRHIPCVSNHNLNASRSVGQALFYPRSRIVPWDRSIIEAGYTPKTGLSEQSALRVFYAGMLSEPKGLGDALEAIAHLTTHGQTVRLSVAGPGDEAAWAARAEALGIASSVHFLGRIPHASVLEHMHAHDVVLVPSRWEYAEGLPNVLCEALAARTPLAISNHPAFADRLINEEDCVIFQAGDSVALAEALGKLASDPALYTRLSKNSAEAVQRLRFGIYWDQLWRLFLDDPLSKTNWVQRNSLAALSE